MASSDLLPESVVLSASSIAPGAALGVSWLLANQGTAATNSSSVTELRINQSASSFVGSDLAGVASPVLSGNSLIAQSAALTAPTTPGVYYVWVIADNNSQVTNQSNTSNDEAHSTAFTVTAPAQSDLIPENISLGSSSVAPGGALSLSWLLANQGSGAANSASTTEIRITSSPTSFGSSSNNVGSVSTVALAGNSSASQNATVTAPTTPGTYYAWVIADNNSQVTNQSTTSNDEQHSIAFTVAAPAQSDLIPETIVLGSSSVVPGGSLSVSWLLANQGTAAAISASTTEIRITTSPTSYGSPSDDVGSVSTAALAGGASVMQSATVPVPTTPGTYYAWVIADNGKQVTNQSNVSNDEQASVAFTVAAPVVTGMTINLVPDISVLNKFGANYQNSAFWQAIVLAKSYFETTFSDPIAFTLDVYYDKIQNAVINPGDAKSSYQLRFYKFDDVIANLKADAKSTDDEIAIAHLPKQDPGNGGSDFELTNVEAKALNLLPADTPIPDDAIGFSSTLDPTQSNFVGIVEHEISEVMGRAGYPEYTTPGYSVLDLFRYFQGSPNIAEPGSASGPNGGSTVFSIDGGTTAINTFDGPGQDDPGGDWSGLTPDAFNGVQKNPSSPVSAGDITVMDVLGYDLAHPANAAPVLIGVSATSYPADNNPHLMYLLGGGFTSADTLTYFDPQGAPYANRAPTLISSSELSYSFNDGGDPGAWSVEVVGPTGTSQKVGFTVAPAASANATSDFNGDQKADILWRNDSGTVALWNSTSTSAYSYDEIGVADSTWRFAGVGDFNGDGLADFLWRNTSGALAMWDANGSGGITGVGASVDNSWQIAGVGDFNGDNKSDILWRNADGTMALWNSTSSTAYAYDELGAVDSSWQVAGVGDFNGDGLSDILWRNTNGALALWDANNAGGVTGVSLGPVDTAWQIVGVGDFNGDHKADIFWRNNDGTIALWQSNASGGYAYLQLGAVDSTWQVATVQDFNGDGLADILWRNASGATAIWQSNGSNGAPGVSLGPVSTDWRIQAA